MVSPNMTTQFKIVCLDDFPTVDRWSRESEYFYFEKGILEYLNDGWSLKGQLSLDKEGVTCAQNIIRNTNNKSNINKYKIISGGVGSGEAGLTSSQHDKVLNNFSNLVNEHLSKDWELYGDCIMRPKRKLEYGGRYIQVVIKRSPQAEVNLLD